MSRHQDQTAPEDPTILAPGDDTTLSELDIARFRGALKRLRRDPAERGRIDAIIFDAELATPADIGDLAEPVVLGGLNDTHRATEPPLPDAPIIIKQGRRPSPFPAGTFAGVIAAIIGRVPALAVLATAALVAAYHATVLTISIVAITFTATAAAVTVSTALLPWAQHRHLQRLDRMKIELKHARSSAEGIGGP